MSYSRTMHRLWHGDCVNQLYWRYSMERWISAETDRAAKIDELWAFYQQVKTS